MREIRIEEHVSLWYDAAKQEHGLCVFPENGQTAETLKIRLCEARADIKDPRIADLKIRTSEDGLELWIYKPSDAQLP